MPSFILRYTEYLLIKRGTVLSDNNEAKCERVNCKEACFVIHDSFTRDLVSPVRTSHLRKLMSYRNSIARHPSPSHFC